MLIFDFLGTVQIKRDEIALRHHGSHTEIALLAYLAYSDRAHSREALAETTILMR